MLKFLLLSANDKALPQVSAFDAVHKRIECIVQLFLRLIYYYNMGCIHNS